MARGAANGRRLATLAAVVTGVAAMVAALTATGPYRLADARLADLVATAVPPHPSPDVVVVAIDEPSFADVGAQWPWPRSLHGRLVQALRAAGARAVGFDIVFAEPSTPAEDAAFAAALGPDVVLGADETLIETAQADQTVRTEPLPALMETGARSGLVSVLLDGDGVLRRLPPFPDGFARRLLEAAGESVREPAAHALVAPVGPARTYRTVSYYQALDPAGTLPPGTFTDAIVLVGLSLQAVPDVKASGTDAFATPFTALTGRLVPGVEVQAAVLDTLRRGLAVSPLPPVADIGFALVAAIVAGLMVRRGTHPAAIASAGVFAVVLAAGSAVLFATERIWASPLPPALAFAGVVAIQGIVDFARERRLRREIVRAFGQYLSPELVERLAREPAALRLGGERRTLTILFCDLAGFTSIAERLKDEPERLTSLVNRLLDPLSAEILKRGGTIDKYIGDCVMAFWNAPLDEPDHAGKAVDAALAMIGAAERIADAIAGETDSAGAPLPRFRVGVGVNTGDVVVGNMGSSARFDYTALGDPVNTAARLQALTRQYGVALLIGAETRRRLGDRYDFHTVDEVVLRGQSTPQAVFTVEAARAEGKTGP